MSESRIFRLVPRPAPVGVVSVLTVNGRPMLVLKPKEIAALRELVAPGLLDETRNALVQLLEFRDAVLSSRHHLDVAGLDNDQINAVLHLFDDLIPIEFMQKAIAAAVSIKP